MFSPNSATTEKKQKVKLLTADKSAESQYAKNNGATLETRMYKKLSNSKN